MKNFAPILLGLSLSAASLLPAVAQAQSTTAPKYLQVIVEYTKPGKGGLAHDKTESAFVQTATKAKYPLHYSAFNALTGKQRAIYLAAFDSFEDLDKANKLLASPAVAPEYERANVNDGELLEETRTLIFKSVPELSFHSVTPSPKNRFLEAQVLQVRPGHAKEFEELAKKVIADDEKAGSRAHWGAYRLLYGDLTGTYVLLTVSDSAADIDQRFGDEPRVTASLSDEEKKKLDELRAAAIESSHRELYSLNPAQSYVSDDYIKADPDFWKPKHTAAPASKAAATDKKATP